MFTGLVQALGRLNRIENHSGDSRLWIHMGELDMSRLQIGDSIAINGACLTVVLIKDSCCAFDASKETLSLTTLGQAQPGDELNLEPALCLNQPLGGHLVSGHVDGLAKVLEVTQEARSWRISLSVPQALSRYIATKGSVTLDGVSLTVNEVKENRFSVNVIPHTLSVTSIQHWSVGRLVNLEVDLIARYVESLLAGGSLNQGQASGATVSESLLRNSGFIS